MTKMICVYVLLFNSFLFVFGRNTHPCSRPQIYETINAIKKHEQDIIKKLPAELESPINVDDENCKQQINSTFYKGLKPLYETDLKPIAEEILSNMTNDKADVQDKQSDCNQNVQTVNGAKFLKRFLNYLFSKMSRMSRRRRSLKQILANFH